MILLVVVFYFILIRPQQKRAKALAALVSSTQGRRQGRHRRRHHRHRHHGQGQNRHAPFRRHQDGSHQGVRHRNPRRRRRDRSLIHHEAKQPLEILLVIVIVAWSLFEIYPPTSRNLVQEFASRAENQDAAFTNILTRLAPLQAARPNQRIRQFGGSHRHERHPEIFSVHHRARTCCTRDFILNQIQRDASGKIKLGLDLQGGTSFLVEMDTNALATPNTDGTNQFRGRRTSAARCHRRSRCCANAWTTSAWPSRSSSRRAATGF